MKDKILILLLAMVLVSPLAMAQKTQPPKENIIHCETLEDIENAKKQGADYIEKSGYYFYRTGSEYKGPFKEFETAKKLRQQVLDEERKKGIITDSNYPGVFNPRLIIDPFVSIDKEKQLLFELPEAKTTKASTVMIHAEPYLFNAVSYGKIKVGKQGDFFAITGQIAKKEKIKLDPSLFTYAIGAAVLGKDGNILWKTYGSVEDDLDFKCVAPLPHTTIQPEYLLLFTVAKGKLPLMLSTDETMTPVDATPYDYHIFCSAVMEVAANWFPPVEEEIKKEYQQMLEADTKAKVEKIKGFEGTPDTGIPK